MGADLREEFESDPGSPACIALARELIARSDLADAQQILIKGLSVNPSLDLARLLLAKVYFLQGFIPFAAKEIAELRVKNPKLEVLKRLHQKLTPHSGSVPNAVSSVQPEAPLVEAGNFEQKIVAETDFEFSEIDLIDKK